MSSNEEIKARLEAASPGPWKVDEANAPDEWWLSDIVTDDTGRRVAFTAEPEMGDDAEFIAHARQDVETLLERVETAEEAATARAISILVRRVKILKKAGHRADRRKDHIAARKAWSSVYALLFAAHQIRRAQHKEGS